MSNPNRIFRQAALDRLASPEQLDELMQVATPRGGWALGACCVLVLLAVVWSIFGFLPTKVSGPGILIRQGGVFVTTARSDGLVMDILVNLGDTVTNLQVLARLKLSELDLRIDHAKIAQAKLQQELSLLDRFHSQEAQEQKEEQLQQMKTYEAMIQDFQAQTSALKERVTNLQQLLRGDSPGVTKGFLLDTQERLSSAQHELGRAQIQLKQIHLNQLQAEERRRQLRAEKEAQLLQSQQNLEFLTRQHQLYSEIRSPFDGNVLDIMVKPGQLITPNTPVMSLQRSGERLEARLFLPPSEGKRVQEGMKVELAPVSIKKELFGLMLGQVTSVAPFPARPESMLRILENPTLVNEFSQRGAPIQVVVSLTPNSRTLSGYLWTSRHGPPALISSGTLCEGTITVATNRPISLVLPLFKETVRW